MDNMKEVRCKSCGKLLGEFKGKGSVKCTRTECGKINDFDTGTNKHEVFAKKKNTHFKTRTTSSGVTFR